MRHWLARLGSPKLPRRQQTGCQPRVEPLEDRTLLASALLTALTTQRSWITYAPSTRAGKPYDCTPTEEKLTKDLQTLYQEGWRGLVTYNMLSTFSDIPRIAKAVGFQYVIAGINYVSPNSPADCDIEDPHTSELNNATNPDIAKYIDGFMVGNEGLAEQPARYTIDDLTKEITALRTNPNTMGKPVTTSEKSDSYLNASEFRDRLRTIGDWWFPNSNFYCWADKPEDPAHTWNNVGYAYNQLQMKAQKVGKIVVYHESWYPTGPANQSLATQQNQVAYYQLMATGQSPYFRGPFYFVWGEAFDQSWKKGEACNQGPNWGLHANNPTQDTRQPKQIVAALQSVYTSNYPMTTSLAGSRLANPRSGKGEVLLTTHSSASVSAKAVDQVFSVGLEGDDGVRTKVDGSGRDHLSGDPSRTTTFTSAGPKASPSASEAGNLADDAFALFLSLDRDNRRAS